MRLGAFFPTNTDDPIEIARQHRQQGYTAGQCPDVEIEDTKRLAEIRKAFAAQDVVIAEVGAWCNMMAPDFAERKKNLDKVARQLAVADEVGANCCVNITGSYNPATWWGPHPKNFTQDFFDQTVRNIRTVIDAVKPKRTTFAVEMMNWTIPSSADEYVRLLIAVDRPAFAVHLDPINIINSIYRYYDTGAVIRDCFDKLGPRIVSCHAKDIRIQDEGTILHFDELPPGEGTFDFATYLRCLSRLDHEAPLCIEHLSTKKAYAKGRDHLKRVAAKCGLSFRE